MTTGLDPIRAHGALRAAVSLGIPGLSDVDANGRWRGIDADFARITAAIVLGDAEAVDWQPTKPGDRIDVVRTGQADLGVCNTSRTLLRETEVSFGEVLCHDGEGFLVHADLGVARAQDLGGRTLAVQAGTTSAENIARWQRMGGPEVTVRECPTPEDTLRAYTTRTADAYVLDTTALAGIRAGLPAPDAHVLLAETISDEPMTPFVHHDNPALLVVIRWAHHLLVAAEAADRTGVPLPRHDIDALGPALGVEPGWASRALAVAGHYGQLFAANLGASSPLNVPRGRNELWLSGGLQYAPPLR